MRQKRTITKQQKIDALKHQRNTCLKLMLKKAHKIQLLQNRKKIDYLLIAANCKDYIQIYNKWTDLLSKIKFEEDALKEEMEGQNE